MALTGPDAHATSLAGWIALMLTPGLAVYVALGRDGDTVEAAVYALALSPVLVAGVTTLSMLAGIPAPATTRALIIVSALLVAAGSLRRTLPSPSIARRDALALLVFIVALCALTSFLPLTDEWWRVRSDAWAHRAYIAEVADFGIPPMDPYFLGFPLQYMWGYHVLINAASIAARVDPFWSMALINVQALAGLILATFLFAGTLTRSAPRRIMSAITVTLGMSAMFWVFLPLRLLKAFTGDTRGLEEVGRQLTLLPYTYRHTMQFIQIFHNKEFFLDKFMVGTAFGLGLCLMAVCWWAATDSLRTGRRAPLVAAFLSMTGLLLFHTLVATVMLGGVFGGLAILYVMRSRVEGFAMRRALVLGGLLLVAVVIAAPYVYSVVHSKDSVGQNSPILFLRRFIGVSITVAFVAVLSWYQRWMVRDRSVSARFVLAAALVVVACAFIVPLPGPNNYDKPPFFVFYPLAVVGAWSLVDLYQRRPRTAVLVTLVALVPVNVLALGACFNTGPEWSISKDERALATWIQDHTARTDVLLDDDDHVDFVVLGPRRHLWGRMGFAYQWGYDRLEMSRRYHAWRTVYSRRPLDAAALETLGSVEESLYVVIRDDRHADGINATRHPEYFESVHRAGSLELLRVDTGRCRSDAVSGRYPRVSEEELLRESGL